MIKSRYNLMFNVKRTAVYFMMEDFYCWIFVIPNTFIQFLIESLSNLSFWVYVKFKSIYPFKTAYK